MHISIIGSISSIHIVRWANALAERGHRIDVLSMHTGSEEFHPSVNVFKLRFKNPYGYILNIPQVKKILKRRNPDIVHAFYAVGHGFLARMSGFPYVVSVMGSDVFDDVKKNVVYRKITVKNIEQAEVVCSTSHIMAKETINLCKKNIDIAITPFGVDDAMFKPTMSNSKKRDEFVIGTVKWLEPKYGVDILIKAFAKLYVAYPDLRLKLIIVGSGSEEEKMATLAEELSIRDKVMFIRSVQHREVPKWLHKFDVYMALSRFDSESFGVAILEASACGLPVIVSDAGGLPEVVKEGETGIIVPRENEEAAFEALQILLKDKQLRKTLGENGRRFVIDNYRWNTSVTTMENVYNKLRGHSEK